MKTPNITAKEAKTLKTPPPISKEGSDLEPEFAEQRLEETEAHDLRRESGHSRKNERHVPERPNRVKPPAKD